MNEITCAKYNLMYSAVGAFSVKQKRTLFRQMREQRTSIDTNIFLAHCGLTTGEFAMMYEFDNWSHQNAGHGRRKG